MNPFEFRGPEFLFFYVVLSAIVLILTSLLRKMLDGGESPALQSPQSLVSDPYLIAHLRGGPAETLRVAAMSLIDRGLLTVDSSSMLKTAPNVMPEHARRMIERAILGLYKTGGKPSDLSALEYATDEFEERLKSLRLLPDGALRSKRWLLFLLMVSVLDGVAAMKIMIGLWRGRPVGFLVILALLNLVLLWKIAQPRLTAQGASFLSSVRRLFAGLKDRAASIRSGGATADLALLAAVFGMTDVPEAVFPYKTALVPPPSSSSNWSSTSSCGSSCGSSSCGGGGGCGGGGCGGCGS